MVGRGQPRIERKCRRLHGEGEQEQRRQREQRSPFLKQWRLSGNVSHVECAEYAIEIGDGDQEQRRRNQIEKGVFGRAIQLRTFRPENEKPKRTDQQHLKPDIKVENVAGQEGRCHARRHQQEKRIETVATLGVIDVIEGIDAARKGHDAGDQRESGAQQIGREGDAEWRQPFAHGHDDRSGVEHAGKQGNVGQQHKGQPDQGDGGLTGGVLAQHQA